MEDCNSNFTFNFRQSRAGFTLVEMMVAVGIFAVVMVVALSSFLNISDVQKKIRSFQIVNDNLSYAMETIVKEIRTGASYCASSCTQSSFSFVNAQGFSVVYRLNNNAIEKSNDGGVNFLLLTSPEIKITDLKFFVRGQSLGDGLQPIVTIIISGSSGSKEKNKTRLNVQATVSQRELDS
ncbi:MAG TPA: prepilin-type N-terminal cleavage/methylation domain-containing protein [bacterium]|nr:prepilin-type N-terminal cleavage/methylation domain-containing protein [bacterium]